MRHWLFHRAIVSRWVREDTSLVGSFCVAAQRLPTLGTLLHLSPLTRRFENNMCDSGHQIAGKSAKLMTREDFGFAYQSGFDLTYRLLRSRGVAPEPAREVTQAAWVRGWERLQQLRNEEFLLTWVNTIALNLHRNWARRDGTWQVLDSTPASMPSLNLAAIDVDRILRNCCASDRSLMEQEMRGVPTREIARRRGVTEGAVRISLLRAHRAARSKVNTAVRKVAA